MIAIIDQGTARYGELKDKMIKDLIAQKEKDGYTCNKDICVKNNEDKKVTTTVL